MVFYWIITLKTVVTHYVVGNPFVKAKYSIKEEVKGGFCSSICYDGIQRDDKGRYLDSFRGDGVEKTILCPFLV